MAPVEHVQLFKVKYSRQKKWHTKPRLSVEPNAHPNRQLPGHFVDHVPSCLHFLLRVTRRLCVPRANRHFGCAPPRVSGYHHARADTDQGQIVALRAHCVCTVWALRAHCVHTAHAEAGILTQEYLSPDWLHSEAAKPT